MRMIAALVFGFICCISTIAHAQVGTPSNRSIETLEKICLSKTGTQKTFCAGYLLGVAEMLLIVGQHGGIGAGIRGVCNNPDQGTHSLDFAIDESPRGFRLLISVYANWVKHNPKLATNDRLSGTMLALQRAWPCRKDEPQKKK